MSQVARIEQEGSQPTRWSEPLLATKLNDLLAGYRGMMSAPVIGPKTAAELQAFVDLPSPWAMPIRDDVVKMMALLANVKRMRKTTDQEAAGQLDQYWQGLRDVPLDDLRHAYDALLKGSPWFPDISEIRQAAAAGPVAEYRRRKTIAQSLILKHQREWTPPIVPITPEEAAQVRAMLEDPLGTNEKDHP